MSRRDSRIQLAVFVLVLWVHFQSEVATPFDSGWSIHVASSLVREGDFDLDEYRQLVRPRDYRVIEVDGHLLPRYPIGPSVAVLPAYAATKSLVKACVGFSLDRYYLNGGTTAGMERWLSSLLMACAAVLVYRLGRRELTVPRSLLVAGVFAFATSAWSVVSRALWQHSPSMVCIGLVLLALTGEPGRRRYALAGFAVAAAYTMRPTNSLLVLAVTCWVVWRQRRFLPRYLAGAALVAVPFLAANLATWNQMLPPYFQPGGGNAIRLAGWAHGLVGTLLSPGRGLFVYSPVLLFCVAGIWLRLRRPQERDLAITFAAVAVAHWLLVSAWFAWWGGEVYGPRLFADLLPIAMYFLIPVVASRVEPRVEPSVESAPEPATRPALARLAWSSVFALTLGWSVWVHSRGANDWAVWDWNRMPSSIDRHPDRLWQWSDPPFLHDEVLPEHVQSGPQVAESVAP